MQTLERYPKEALIYFLTNSERNLKQKDPTKKKILKYIGANPDISQTIHTLIESVPVFKDPMFIDCWNAAFPPDGNFCLKTSFGACAYDSSGNLITTSNNRRIGRAFGIEAPFCSPQKGCIREKLESRSDQVIGECDHSIVGLFKKIFEHGYGSSDLPSLKICEAGFLVNKGFRPWWRKANNYTCLYCVRIFLTFGLETVWGVVGEGKDAIWKPLSVKEDYAELAQEALEGIALG